jgi:hypothetical protein
METLPVFFFPHTHAHVVSIFELPTVNTHTHPHTFKFPLPGRGFFVKCKIWYTVPSSEEMVLVFWSLLMLMLSQLFHTFRGSGAHHNPSLIKKYYYHNGAEEVVGVVALGRGGFLRHAVIIIGE